MNTSAKQIAPAKKRRKRREGQLGEFLCTLPAVALVLLTIYYPLADLVRVSFTNWNLLSTKYKYVGLKNWNWFFNSSTGNDFVRDM